MVHKQNVITRIIHIITDYFDNNSIPYVIVGGIAVISWGRPRTTQDIDIIIDHEKLSINDFSSFLSKNNFFVETQEIIDGFNEKSQVTILDKQSLFRIDLTGLYDENKRDSLNHRQPQKLEGKIIYIDSPENLISHKLLFGSEQDFQDALAIYTRVINKLDKQRLLNLVIKLGVEKEFELLQQEYNNNI